MLEAKRTENTVGTLEAKKKAISFSDIFLLNRSRCFIHWDTQRFGLKITTFIFLKENSKQKRGKIEKTSENKGEKSIMS